MSKPKSERGAAAADAEKQSAEKIKAELEELDDLDLEKVVGGATKKSTIVAIPNPGGTVTKKGAVANTPSSTVINSTIVKR